MGVVGYRTTNLHLREVNAGEWLRWINWSNKPGESNSQWTSQQTFFFCQYDKEEKVLPSCQTSEAEAWKWPDFIIVVMSLKSLHGISSNAIGESKEV